MKISWIKYLPFSKAAGCRWIKKYPSRTCLTDGSWSLGTSDLWPHTPAMTLTCFGTPSFPVPSSCLLHNFSLILLLVKGSSLLWWCRIKLLVVNSLKKKKKQQLFISLFIVKGWLLLHYSHLWRGSLEVLCYSKPQGQDSSLFAFNHWGPLWGDSYCFCRTSLFMVNIFWKCLFPCTEEAWCLPFYRRIYLVAEILPKVNWPMTLYVLLP